jgi:flagellar protein FliS
MSYAPPPPGLAEQYKRQQILNASPAQQVVMLYDGAIKFCQQAKECIAKGDIQGRHNANKRAMEVVSYMLDILDIEKGGDVALRLQLIYAFLLRRMLEVDFRNDPRICDEVAEHLRILRASWEKIGQGESAKAAGSPPTPVGTPGGNDDGLPPRITAAVA